MSQTKPIVSEFAQPDRNRQQGIMQNPSGLQPVEYKCLVKPYHIMETDDAFKRAREAGIEIAQSQTEREQYAQCVALLVAVGGSAFEDWNGLKPEVGDRILMAKYAGVEVDGVDGRQYRLVSDKDLAAVLFKPEGLDPGVEDNGEAS